MKLSEKKACIRNSIEKILLPLGFKTEFFRVGRVSGWLFERDGAVRQTIEITDQEKRINMKFSTNVRTKKVYAGELKNKNSMDHLKDSYLGYDYGSLEEFQNIVNEFADIIMDFGLEQLEKLSVVPDGEIAIRQEHFERLKERSNDAIAEFQKKYGSSSKSEQLQILVNSIEILRGEKIELATERLIDLSAVYGDWIISMFGGNWTAREKDYVVCDVGPDKSTVITIRDVFRHFGKRYRISYEKLCERHGENNYTYQILKKPEDRIR